MGMALIIASAAGTVFMILWSAAALLKIEREKNDRAQAEIRALEDKLREVQS